MQNIGGQAVIEGVMFKGKNKIAVAVRDPKDKIITKVESYKSLTKNKLLGLPFIRGIVILFETLIQGMKALNYSANISVSEDGEQVLGFWSILFTFIFSIGLALLLFKFLPFFLADLINFENKYLYNATEGLIKLIILTGYIYVISLMPDVKRVFQYHGAEHKIVNAYEDEQRITKDNMNRIKTYSTLHPRCGSSFIIFVIFLSIIAYIFIPLEYSFWIKFGIRIALLPIIAGVAYELIKLSGKYRKSKFLLALISPGLLLQKITTREPDEKQIEVAMKSFDALQ
ncbi:MAG: DUF1385 domain-containing protein [archaeon]